MLRLLEKSTYHFHHEPFYPGTSHVSSEDSIPVVLDFILGSTRGSGSFGQSGVQPQIELTAD